MESSKKLIVFDLDGTLNQTSLYALKAYHNTFRDMNIGPFTDDDILSRFGASFEEDVHYFFNSPTQNTIKRYEQLLSYYWNQYLNEAKTYPNVKEVLRNLKDKGNILCVCSNAPEEELHKTLSILGIKNEFDAIQGITEKHSKVHSLSLLIKKYQPLETIMVGDRFYDAEAAKKNNAKFIGCQYGYGHLDELKNADFIIKEIKELEKVI